MGKNNDRESLIRLIANTVVHQIVAKHTNRPESSHFLESEIIEYQNQTQKAALKHNWNVEDKEYIEREALQKIREKLDSKYTDVSYEEDETIKTLKGLIDEIM